ncbi:hypothetical protein ACGFY7_23420 [Streptomyces prunicolor]|uniref:hypothetical protein n=1 Tax=Streptomyces prunicolor TaxID=67348 RepID=UPI00372022C5
MTEQPIGPRCGNNPNFQMSDRDQKAVDDFKARLALQSAVKPHLDSAVWVDGDPLMEVIAVTLWERCARDDEDMPQMVRDDPRTIAAFAAAVARAHAEAEPPLSPYYEHPECGFHWHGKDGMDVPLRDGEPVCPRCELARTKTTVDLLRRTEAYLSALHGSVARHDNLAANLGCAGCELRDQVSTELRHPAAEVADPETITRVIELYERWIKAGPPPLGTLMARWWDARLAELHAAIIPPTPTDEAHT